MRIDNVKVDIHYIYFLLSFGCLCGDFAWNASIGQKIWWMTPMKIFLWNTRVKLIHEIYLFLPLWPSMVSMLISIYMHGIDRELKMPMLGAECERAYISKAFSHSKIFQIAPQKKQLSKRSGGGGCGSSSSSSSSKRAYLPVKSIDRKRRKQLTELKMHRLYEPRGRANERQSRRRTILLRYKIKFSLATILPGIGVLAECVCVCVCWRRCSYCGSSNPIHRYFKFKMKMLCRKLETNASMITLWIFDRFDFQLLQNPLHSLWTICMPHTRHLHTHYIVSMDWNRKSLIFSCPGAEERRGTNENMHWAGERERANSYRHVVHLPGRLYFFCSISWAPAPSAAAIGTAIHDFRAISHPLAVFRFRSDRLRYLFGCFYAIDMI